MFNLIYPIIRFILFRMDAEKTHDLTLKWLKKIEASSFRWLIHQPMVNDPVEVFGIQFPNKIGLAAGLDKNGACIDAFAALGFGHIEVGTVTPRPQPGNPKPRLFRLPEAKGIINRFGFNNQGVDQLISNIKSSSYTGILGINIGKNFDTPVENAVDDYLVCMQKIYPYASYITVNISSPNTANLRQLQFGEALEELLVAIKSKQHELTQSFGRKIPVLIKIAPDLNEQEIDVLAETFIKNKVDGIIATNTTFSREGVEKLKYADEQGGLSGKPVFAKSTEVLKRLSEKVNGAFPIIGVGGIDSLSTANEKLDAGASLVQVYSGFIYQGPNLIKKIAEGV
ncbi:quinone-dependent dihydroorotate dehydrogenase [Aliikangiella sp. IMCC44359]|uniref:quinone-dependent dihydroorotate dehydrogenase n=1 Tax=Aliikangiella sp. IMCC44359 TaxID=3459125 RepID=UPI00403B3510